MPYKWKWQNKTCSAEVLNVELKQGFFYLKTQTTRGAYETAEIKCHTSETKVLQLQINAPWKYIIKGKTDSSGP